jgi:predicted glycogen debranching enzyme
MREWLVTNGLGGYASLTNNGANTRKYHGLLVSSLNPPTNRWVFVSNVHNKIQINNKIYTFNHYGCNFSYDLFPTFTCNFDKMTFKKTVFMAYGEMTWGLASKTGRHRLEPIQLPFNHEKAN